MVGIDVTIVPGKVDACEVVGEADGNDRMTIRAGELLVASGWIFPAEKPIEQVWISIDGVRCAPGSKGYERNDVAKAFGRPDLASCGFRAIVTVEGLSAGRHTLAVEAIDGDGRFLRADGDAYEFEIADGRASDHEAIARIEALFVDGEPVDPNAPVEIGPDSVVTLAGWAISERRSGIAAFLRGDSLIPLGYGFQRRDVAEVFGNATLDAGFEGALDAATIASAGNHLQVVLISHDARALIETDAFLEIEVVDS